MYLSIRKENLANHRRPAQSTFFHLFRLKRNGTERKKISESWLRSRHKYVANSRKSCYIYRNDRERYGNIYKFRIVVVGRRPFFRRNVTRRHGNMEMGKHNERSWRHQPPLPLSPHSLDQTIINFRPAAGDATLS